MPEPKPRRNPFFTPGIWQLAALLSSMYLIGLLNGYLTWGIGQ